MKEALKDSQSRNGAEQSARGQRALQQLNEAAGRLAQGKQAAIKEGLDRVAEESGKLVKQQEKIQEELDRLARQMPQPESPEEAIERSEDLVSSKNELKERLDSLENRIRDLSRQARKTEKPASSELAEAAETIRDRRLSDRIQEGSRLIRNGLYESQKRREDFIHESLEEVQQKLEAAKSRLGESEEGRIEEAVNRVRQLSEGLQSIQRRMSEMQSGRGNRSDMPQQGQKGSQQREGQGLPQTPSGQQAQNGQGTPAEQGRDAQDPQGGNADPDASIRELSDNASGPPAGIGQHRDDPASQLTRELEQRLTDARDLRGLMNRNPAQMQSLEEVIDALRRSRNDPDYGSAEQIALLKAAIDQLRTVESDLARDLERLKRIEEYFVAGNDEAPEAYRKLVEEYYRSLAETK
jgi:chromosome segregation ATPase